GRAARAGRAAEARESYEAAWVLGRDRDTGVLVDAALGIGDVVVSAGRVDAGLARHLERTAALLGPADEVDRIRVAARLAVELYWGPELPRARILAAESVAAARAFDDPRALTAALAAAQFVLRGPEGPEDRIALGRELADLAVRRGDEDAELLARRMLVPELMQSDPVQADAELDVLAELATSTGRPLAQWYVLLFRAVRSTMAGHTDALDLVEQAYRLGRLVQAQPASIYATGQRFALRRDLPAGSVEHDLRRHVARYPVLTVFRCQLAVVLAENGRGEEACALLDELTAGDCAALPPDSLWLANAGLLAEAAALLDHGRHAEHLHAVLSPYADRVAMQGVPIWNGAVARYLALTATTLGRWDEADTRFQEALRIHEAWGAAPLSAQTMGEHAAMLRRRGAPGDRTRAARLAAGPPTPASTAAPLTAREFEVLDALAAGSSNKEIARRLHLSVHTVERHVANIYVKIGARNRSEATAFAIRPA
ncbi:MAG: response regulator transcription factor, partial [Pseudonocardia sp.]|nr:response regulator transcription factor [Pseudonocardia sp.]